MKSKLACSLLALACLTFLFLFYIPKIADFSYGKTTTKDFVQYWSAFQLISSGENPYLPENMLELQNELQGENKLNTAFMMWNPPWTVLILSPVLIHSFPQSASLWLLCNIIFLISSGVILKKVFLNESKQISPTILVVSSLFFIPAWETINWGQLSLFLLFSFSLFLYGLEKNKDFFTLSGICGMSLKPQLFLIIGLIFIWQLIKEKKFHLLLKASLSLVVLMLSSEYFLNNAVLNWLKAPTSVIGNPHCLSIFEWMPATLMTLVRAYSGYQNKSIMWLLSIVIILITIFFLSSRKTPLSWRTHTPIFLSLSFLSAPYAWVYDQSLLLVIQLFLVFKFLENKKHYKYLFSALGIQFLYLLFRGLPNIAQHHYAIFPPLWLLLSYLTVHQLENDRL